MHDKESEEEMKRLKLTVMLGMAALPLAAETLLDWTLAGYANRTELPVTIATADYGAKAASVEDSVLSFGAGALAAAAANAGERQLVAGMETAGIAEAVAADDYLSFSVAAVGDPVSISEIRVNTRGNGTTATWVIRSSIDNFTTDLGSFTTFDGAETVGSAMISGLNAVSAVEFRIYGYGMAAGSSVQLRGGTTSALKVIGGASVPPQPEPPADQPDIVLILVDDMGYSDIGAFGSEIQTPHLDRLANQGIRFTHFYNQAKCETTRAAIDSGAYQQQIAGQALGSGLASELNALGYRTLYSGKNHGGRVQDYDMRTSMDGGAENHFNPGLQREGESDVPARKPGDTLPSNNWTIDNVFKNVRSGAYRFPADFYSTTFYTGKAIEYLQNQVAADEPFFLYLAYTAPHWPLHALPEDKALYADTYQVGWDVIRAQRFARLKKLGILPETAQLSPRDPDVPAWDSLSPAQRADYADRMATHAAMIHRVDQEVGRLMETIEAMGRAENLVTVFLSDNGATNQDYYVTTRSDGSAPDTTSQTSYVGFGPGWCDAANSPFRQLKRNAYEGGSKTPMFMHWPAGIAGARRGELNPSVGHVIDLLPTFVHLGGGTPPGNIEGKSLYPVLLDGTRSGAEAPAYIGLQYGSTLGLRKGDYKIVTKEGRNWGLYNVMADPAETDDLSADPSKAATLAELEASFDAWATRGGIGVRTFFVGSYDGGAGQGARPVPGGGGAITVTGTGTAGFQMAITAASDAETPSTSLTYASYWSYRDDLATVDEIRAHAENYNTWAANKRSFSIPQSDGFYRGTIVQAYVLVRDAQLNAAVYGPAAAAIPYLGTPPTPGEITAVEVTGLASARITWTAASDDQAGVRTAIFVAERPLMTVGDAFAYGRLLAPVSAGLTEVEAERLSRGTSWFAVVAIDSDDNAVLYPLAAAVQSASIELAVGAVSRYSDMVQRMGSPSELLDPHGDANQNGLSNLIEYAFGSDPSAQPGNQQTVLHLDGTWPPSLRFYGDRDLRDLQYQVVADTGLDFGPDAVVLFDSASDRWMFDPTGMAVLPTNWTDPVGFFRIEVRQP